MGCATHSARLQRCTFAASIKARARRGHAPPLWRGLPPASAPALKAATLARASKIMAPTSCLHGQVHRLPNSPETYGAMITRPSSSPMRSADLI